MTCRVRTVRLYGELGARYGRVFHLAVASAAEAVNALCNMIDGFEAHLMESKDRGVGYAVFLGKTNIREDQLTAPVGREEIRIAPITSGSKKNGLFQIIVGAVLVIVGVVLMYFGQVWAINLVKMGAGLIAGGIVQLLSPQPKKFKPQERPENDPNKYFSGPVNTEAQGQPVPVLLGRAIVGSAVISAGIEIKDNVYVPTPSGGGTNTSNRGGGGSSPWHQDWASIINGT